MSLGAATVNAREGHDSSPVKFDLVSFVGDDAYPTGGTAAFQAYVRTAVGRGSLTVLGVIPQDCGGFMPVYDKANDKLKVYTGASGANAEVANTTDLSGTTFNVLVVSV